MPALDCLFTIKPAKVNPSGADHVGADIIHLPERPLVLPVVKLNVQTLHYNKNNDLIGELHACCGSILFEISHGFLYCRSDRETMINNGIIRYEWLPDIPGNGRFSHTIVLNEICERIGLGRTRGLLTQHRIYIRAWGYSPLIVEIRLPMTDSIKNEVEAWKAQNRRCLPETGNV